MQNIKKLHTKNWQHQRNTIGEVVTEINDIKQCIDTICLTAKGSVPFMPELGTNAFEALGENSDDAIGLIIAMWEKEIPLQEPRCEITDITGNKDENGKILMEIYFRKKSKNKTEKTEKTEVYI